MLGRRIGVSERHWHGAKTCNLAVAQPDFIAVNGFDESYTGWGFDDSDLVVRLFRYGVCRKEAFGRALVFHLYHSLQDKIESESKNHALFIKTKDSKPLRAPCGLDGHQSHPDSPESHQGRRIPQTFSTENGQQ